MSRATDEQIEQVRLLADGVLHVVYCEEQKALAAVLGELTELRESLAALREPVKELPTSEPTAAERGETEPSEIAKKAAGRIVSDLLIGHAVDVEKVIQSAIDAATAELRAENERLKAELAALRKLAEAGCELSDTIGGIKLIYGPATTPSEQAIDSTREKFLSALQACKETI